MVKTEEAGWQFCCPECGFGHVEFGFLAHADELECIVCLEENGRSIRLVRWIAVAEDMPAT